MIWQNLTSRRLAEVERCTPVLLPLAAIEQHGPHLPLATDRIINEYFCGKLEEEISESVLILPTISVTCSQHHMGFPGTLTLTHETLGNQTGQILNSAASHGFHNLILFNSHGGNQAIGQVTAERFGASHPDCRVVMVSWWKTCVPSLREIHESGPGGVGHACEFETSLLLLIAPELVDQDQIEPMGNVATYPWAEGDLLDGPRASLYRSMNESTTNGTFGDPTKATREKGVAITRAVVDAMKEIVDDLAAP